MINDDLFGGIIDGNCCYKFDINSEEEKKLKKFLKDNNINHKIYKSSYEEFIDDESYQLLSKEYNKGLIKVNRGESKKEFISKNIDDIKEILYQSDNLINDIEESNFVYDILIENGYEYKQ